MKVLVFGLGYVGAVTAACLADVGHHVVGVDIDSRKVDAINRGASPILEPGLAELIDRVVAEGRLRATVTGRADLLDADVSLVSVGTPSTAHGGLDVRHLEAVCGEIGVALAGRDSDAQPRHVVAIRSTVLPGTVEQVVVPALERAGGLRAGQDFSVAMCPEFLRESTSIHDFFDPPFTIIGADDPVAVAVLGGLFAFVEPVLDLDLRSAEALKYSCNAFHAVKVAFANEIGRFCHRTGADARKVMDVFCLDDRLNLSRYYLRPGFAFGGSCLPKDVRAMVHRSRHDDLNLPLLQAVLPSNEQHLASAVERLLDTPPGRVALLGLSFKGGTDDLRESPAVELAEVLTGKGFDLRIYDDSIEPDALLGSNLDYVAERLPHLGQLLSPDPVEAMAGADWVVVTSSSARIQDAVQLVRPSRLLDLSGNLRPQIEELAGFEGLAW